MRDPTFQSFDPFSWWIQELGELTPTPACAAERHRLTAALVAEEAFELAHGLRHLSVLHGDGDANHRARLDTLFAALAGRLAGVSLVRWGGSPRHLTVTVGGDRADDWIGEVAAIVEAHNPGWWVVVASARVDPIDAPGPPGGW